MFVNFHTVQEYEMMNMFKLIFFISGNVYFSFVSTSLVYISIPQKQKKTKITWDKKLTTTNIWISLIGTAEWRSIGKCSKRLQLKGCNFAKRKPQKIKFSLIALVHFPLTQHIALLIYIWRKSLNALNAWEIFRHKRCIYLISSKLNTMWGNTVSPPVWWCDPWLIKTNITTLCSAYSSNTTGMTLKAGWVGGELSCCHVHVPAFLLSTPKQHLLQNNYYKW